MPTTNETLTLSVDQNAKIIPVIVEGLCQLEGVNVSDLEPIYDTVEVDFLERLVSYSLGDVEVRFKTNGWNVKVLSNGLITLSK